MAVDPVAPGTSAGAMQTASKSSAATKAASLNYNNFLKLLIAQMKHQDPTDPMDATQQVAQLATFSQVEQSIQTNKNLESLLQGQSLSQASSYIGKYISNADGTQKGTISQVQVYSDGVVAVTNEGAKILIQPGIVISDKAAS